MNNLLINKKREVEILFRKYADDVFRFAYSKTQDRTVSEEIVSDTFLTLVNVLDRYDNNSNIKSYLFGIALNKLRQYWVKKNENVIFDEEIHNTQEVIPSGNRKRLFNKLLNIIEQLPLNYKSVIKLRYLEFKSIKEVADIIGISTSNVTTIQNRALNKIRNIVNGKI